MAQNRTLSRLLPALCLGGAVLLPATAQAQGPRAMTIGISATVGLFCRIEQVEQPVFVLSGGRASLGPVREICNAPTGYVVTTSFTNLAAGRLLVAGSGYGIVDGQAMRAVTHADAATNDWSLDEATAADASQPVIVTITISPA